MLAPTRRQREILDFITQYIESHGARPSYQLIARHMGVSSKGGIARIVTDLEAQGFLASYKKLLDKTADASASEATIQLMYQSYYAEMGGAGKAPEIPARSADPASDAGNVTAFRRPPARSKPAAPGATTKPPLPVALIFACLVVVYVGIRYYWR